MVGNYRYFSTIKFVSIVTFSCLVITLFLDAYLIQSKYQNTVDDFLSSSANEILQDGAESGAHPESQKILILKSRALINQMAMHSTIQIFSSCNTVQAPTEINRIGNIALQSPLLFWVSLNSAYAENFVTVQCELKIERWLLLAVCLSLLSITLYLIRPRPLSAEDSSLLVMLSEQLSDTKSIKMWKESIKKFRTLNPDAVINTRNLRLYLSNNVNNDLSSQDILAQLQLASQPDSVSFSLENEKLKVSVNNIVIPICFCP